MELITFYLYMSSLPTLSTWHTTILKNEFTTDSHVKDIEAYMSLKKQLFTDLETEVHDKTLPIDTPKRVSQTLHRGNQSDKVVWGICLVCLN